MTDQPEQDWRITLNPSQADVVERHRQRIANLVADLSTILKDDQAWSIDSPLDIQRYPPADFKQPRTATTLAVLGPRGSGKSTCMVDLLRKLEGTETAGFHLMGRVIDCSLGSPNAPFGLSVLMRLRYLLGLQREPPGTSAWSCQGEKEINPNTKEEQRRFKVLREAYMLSRRAAVRVLENTSSGGPHFAQQAAWAAAEALALPDRVADWLQCAARCCGPGVAGFVAVLDDVDLARDGILDMVYSLLDELHQPRLILVIGADFPRLEQRITDSLAADGWNRRRLSAEKSPPSSPEDVTANDLLYKILPQVNREWLRPWTDKDRWSFPPRPAPAYPLDSSLGGLLIDRKEDWGHTFLTPALLPGYPRHLENLWRVLATPRVAKEGARERSSLRDLGEFMTYLAEARGDYGLARRLALRATYEWGRTFRWEEEPIPKDMWDRLVDAALKKVSLSGLVAMSDDLPLPQDPSSAALWTEFLLDLSLASGQLTAAELIRRFPRMSDLVDQAQIRTDFHRDEMAQPLRHARGSVMVKLAWTRFDVALDRHGILPKEFDAHVGLEPLREAIEGRRNAWPWPLVQGLYLRRSEVLDDRQRAYDTKGNPDDVDALLPRGVRPLIVFVDSLSRAPWRLLSETPWRRSFRASALFAAGLVRAAYVDALDRVFDALEGRGSVNKAARPVVSAADRSWLDAVRDRGHTPIVEWSDDVVEDRFHAILEEEKTEREEEKTEKEEEEKEPKWYRELVAQDLPTGLDTDVDWEFVFAPYNALVRCLDAYTSSRAFRHLADPGRSTKR